jgi:ribosomal protein L39E
MIVSKVTILTSWVPIVVSSAGAAVVTLLGAVTGGAIAGHSQRRHWTRDKQIEACTAIASESTRTQLALRRLWRRGEKVDWNGWNQALALISLVGTPALIASADEMDAVFWRSTSRMEEVAEFDEVAWADIVQEMEAARLSFINVARREIIGISAELERLPIARPAMPKNRLYTAGDNVPP